MANIKSSKKRIETNERDRKRNQKQRGRLSSARRRMEDVLENSESEEEVEDALENLMSVAQKAAAKGAIHQNKADRIVSRYHRRLKKKFQPEHVD